MPRHMSITVTALVLFWLACLGGCRAGASELFQTPVFVSGREGYHTFRIPSLIVTKRGTLLAFCEGRKKGRGDSGDIDLLLKRSFDNGQTWSKAQVVWDDGENTCGNPCPVVDTKTGAIWLLMTHNLGSDIEAQIMDGKSRGTRSVWLSKSLDDGASWSKPVEITKDVKKPDWRWYATGPGVGIQTKSGRLVIPCDNSVAGSKVLQAHVIYSDDHGQTWKLGGVVGPQCDESQVVELDSGSLMLNIRSYRGKHRRLIAISKNGGATFSTPVEDRELVEPECQGSIVRYSGEHGGLLFSNPASEKRERMTVRLSRDQGNTWPHAKMLHSGSAAYSCLAMLPDGRIGCLYERGDQTAYETITFARFSLDWLTDTAASRKVQLVPNPKGNGYDFETEQIQGTIRPDGQYHGVTRLVHKRTGRQVIDPRYSALNLFKLMAVNQCMGQPRTMERTTKIGERSVELTWPATQDHRAQIVARYEVIPPNAVELTVSVRSEGTYPGYELFLPNYFDKALRPFIYLKPARSSEKPELVVPTVNDVFRGMLPVFPRDAHAARRCVDGRWDRVETNAPTVPQCPARRYGHCLAFAADAEQKFAAVLMARPSDCYAISARYHAEKDADRLAPYTAFDFSLFGDDLLPGGGRTVKVRLALTDLDQDMSQPLKLYESFLSETEKKRHGN